MSYNDRGLHRISPITVTRCGIDERAGATAPSISAIDQKGRAFRGSIRDYYLTALEAENEARVGTYGDLHYPAHYSTDWAQGGKIIERVGIAIRKVKVIKSWHWEAGLIMPSKVPSYGPTPLVAAMRVFVASKLGDKIEIPDELVDN